MGSAIQVVVVEDSLSQGLLDVARRLVLLTGVSPQGAPQSSKAGN